MSQPTHQTPPDVDTAIARGDREAALAWLEQVGSWPSSDSDVQATTNAANSLLGFPTSGGDACDGTLRNGPDKRHARCDVCGHVDHEANEGDVCGHAPPQSRAHTAAAFKPGDRVVDRVNGKAGRVLGSQPPAVAGWPRSYTIAWEDGTEGGGWYDEDLDGGAS